MNGQCLFGRLVDISFGIDNWLLFILHEAIARFRAKHSEI